MVGLAILKRLKQWAQAGIEDNCALILSWGPTEVVFSIAGDELAGEAVRFSSLSLSLRTWNGSALLQLSYGCSSHIWAFLEARILLNLAHFSTLCHSLALQRSMAVHQLWRFPRGVSDLQLMFRQSTEEAEIPGLEQLNSAELDHLQDVISRYHTPPVAPRQSCSMVVKRIKAPVEVVWSVVRRFDNPQAYKHFIRSCFMQGDGQVGSTREVRVVSGLPAASSTERLEVLDDERHVLSFKVVGGQHRLRNYFSTTTLHWYVIDGCPSTLVIESYSVDVPEGNTREETRVFADTIVRSNLQSLARTSELLARNLVLFG